MSLHNYFRDIRPERLGLLAAVTDIRLALSTRFDPESVVKADLPPNVEIFEQLYSEEGRDLLQEFQAQYETSFRRLVKETRRIGATLLVLYIPPTLEHEMAGHVGAVDGQFFSRLAAESESEYLDLGDLFSSYSKQDMALTPENLHLSRFGNRLLAAAVAEKLQPLDEHRSSFRFDERPELFGDLPQKSHRIWQDVAHPFRVSTSAQGLRMTGEVTFPKSQQRILLLGDSFTFGYNAHDTETYPVFLQRMLPDREIINAGVPGYTIVQQVPLFMERARYTEPDIIVLQTLFNDLYGMFSFERNIFSRDLKTRGFWLGKRIRGCEKMRFAASELEQRFIEGLRRKSRGR